MMDMIIITIGNAKVVSFLASKRGSCGKIGDDDEAPFPSGRDASPNGNELSFGRCFRSEEKWKEDEQKQ